MKPADPSFRLDALLQRLLDDSLSDADGCELNALLRDSQEARARYRKSLQLHAALIRYPRMKKGLSPLAKPSPAGPARLAVLMALAACLMLAAFFFPSGDGKPVAVLSGTADAVWLEKTDDALLGRQLHLRSGFAEISFISGVRVILEGPCQFQVTSESSMEVAHGRATVKVPKHIDGFHLDTPAGRITDLGTEFGVAVGSGSEGPVVLTEVFEGEIEIPAEDTPRKRMLVGESLAIVGESGGTRLVSTLGDYQVNLADSARHLPAPSAQIHSSGNLALGKPVTSPAYYSKDHGSIFPPENLTDGRINDTGSPGDWSFWLAPNGEPGEFTVDLLERVEIGRIEMQNTRNRTHGDRGLRDISIQVSDDNENFHEIALTQLKQIKKLPAPGVGFPFETITFKPVTARFVKVLGLSYYRDAERPHDNPNEGGGLNEIRIFAQ
jgi:ferric-dicitrate binding protein FerR (iron transport regulator)